MLDQHGARKGEYQYFPIFVQLEAFLLCCSSSEDVCYDQRTFIKMDISSCKKDKCLIFYDNKDKKEINIFLILLVYL